MGVVTYKVELVIEDTIHLFSLTYCGFRFLLSEVITTGRSPAWSPLVWFRFGCSFFEERPLLCCHKGWVSCTFCQQFAFFCSLLIENCFWFNRIETRKAEKRQTSRCWTSEVLSQYHEQGFWQTKVLTAQKQTVSGVIMRCWTVPQLNLEVSLIDVLIVPVFIWILSSF